MGASKQNSIFALSLALAAMRVQGIVYNGAIQYFIADLGPTSPCHPMYERSYTYVDFGEEEVFDRVLNAIVEAGFNGIRLPMWPDSDRLAGPDPDDFDKTVGKFFCDLQSTKWVKRIKTAPKGAAYANLQIYVSPGLDNRALQDELTMEEYAEWVLSYTSGDYSPNFISPFSANDSTLRLQSIPDNSVLSDITTMWEMETLKYLKEQDTWKDLALLKNAPQMIGPDRATVQHSANVFTSFKEDVSYIRPDYSTLVDIRGSQARYVDVTAKESNYRTLSENGIAASWCTMCSQEWYRTVDKPLGYGSGTNLLRASQVQAGFWSSYTKYWGDAQAPASQALLGDLQGFVAEAAIPRFLTNTGLLNEDRSWTQGDKMIDIDDSPKTFDSYSSTEDRNIMKPLKGFRKNLASLLPAQMCQFKQVEPSAADNTDDTESTASIDRYLPGYQECIFELTERQFKDNNYEPIQIYTDTPKGIYAFLEFCQTTGKLLCNTVLFQVGTEVNAKYDPEIAVRVIFENDESEDQEFVIELSTESGETLALIDGQSSLLTATQAVLLATTLTASLFY